MPHQVFNYAPVVIGFPDFSFIAVVNNAVLIAFIGGIL